jgi:hypothetical protein
LYISIRKKAGEPEPFRHRAKPLFSISIVLLKYSYILLILQLIEIQRVTRLFATKGMFPATKGMFPATKGMF